MTTVERAFVAAAEHDYSGAESRALLRRALDADHETGENCLTSRGRVHRAAGYADDGGRCRSAARAIARFETDGVIRPGIGRLYTVCPVGDWSGTVARHSSMGRRLANWLDTRDVQTSPDQRTSGPTTSLPTDLRDAAEREVEFDPNNLVRLRRVAA